MTALEQRVSRLEKENRAWRLLGLLVAVTMGGVLVLGADDPKSETADKGKDKEKTTAAAAAATSEPAPASAPAAQARPGKLAVGTLSAGVIEAEQVILKTKGGRAFASLSLEQSASGGETSTLRLFGKDGAAAIQLQASEKMATVELSSGKAAGRVLLSQGLDDKASSTIQLFSQDGKDLRSVTIARDAAAVKVEIRDPAGNVASQFSYP